MINVGFISEKYSPIMSADYVIMIYDVIRSAPVFIYKDFKQSFTAKSGETVRTPHSHIQP